MRDHPDGSAIETANARLRRSTGSLFQIIKALVPNWLRDRLPHKLRGVRPLPWVLVDSFSRSRRKVTFVQIGANDGVRYDPIREFVLRDAWHGVLVEPLQPYFDRLCHNYRDCAGLRFEPSAIAAENGVLELYRVDTSRGGFPDWVEGLASSNREQLLSRTDLDLTPDMIVRESVPAITLSTLFARHGLSAVDVVCVDTEGQDDAIVAQVLALEQLPAMIWYEHGLLGDARQRSLRTQFGDRGFKVVSYEGDSLAYRGALERLRITDWVSWSGFRS